MAITNKTQYVKATRAEILAQTNLLAGSIAVATDTYSLMVWNGTEWSETPVGNIIGVPHTLPGTTGPIPETPFFNFDASQTSSMKTATETQPAADDSIVSWADMIGDVELIQPVGTRQPTYLAADHNGNPGVHFYGNQFMHINQEQFTKKTNMSFTIVLVFSMYDDSTYYDKIRADDDVGDTRTAYADGVGGRYLYSEYDLFKGRTNNTITENNFLFCTKEMLAHQDFDDSDTFGFNLYMPGNDTYLQHHDPAGTATLVTFSGHKNYSNLMSHPPEDEPNKTVYKHLNENFHKKPQAISMRISLASDNKSRPKITNIWHTLDPERHGEAKILRDEIPINGSIKPTIYDLLVGTFSSQVNNYCNFRMHQILTFGTFLSNGQLMTLGEQLKTKWGLDYFKV